MLHSLRSEKGVALLWTAVTALILFAIGAFAVDLGNLWLVRNELQNTADSAALAAASALGSGDFKQVYARARAWAAENTADGEAVNLNYEDIEVGRWNQDTRTFTAYDPFDTSVGEKELPNAVKVTASRDDDHTGPVQLCFGRLLGQDEAKVSADAIAVGEPGISSVPPPVPVEQPVTRSPISAPTPVTRSPISAPTPVTGTPTPISRSPIDSLPGHNNNGEKVFIPTPNLGDGSGISIPKNMWDSLSPDQQANLKYACERDPYVIYIMDASDSMVNSMDESKELAQALLNWSETAVVGKLITKVGLASFDNDARMEQDLSDNVGAVYEGIDQLHFGEVPEENHSVARALDMSMERLWEEPTGELQVDKIAYIFSDGRFAADEIQQVLAAAKRANAGRENEKGEVEPIIVYTFGIGEEVNEETLQALAEATGGRYYTFEDAMAGIGESKDNYLVWLVE